MSTEPKWLHPSVTSKIIDNAVVVLTASGLSNMFVALEAEKGMPNQATYISSTSQYIFLLGDPNYSKWGQSGMNAINWLRAGGGIWLIRVVPDDETFASLSLGIGYQEEAKYTNDEEEYVSETMTADQITLWNASIATANTEKIAKGSSSGKTLVLPNFYAGVTSGSLVSSVNSKLGLMTADAIKVYNNSNGSSLEALGVKKETTILFGLRATGSVKTEAFAANAYINSTSLFGKKYVSIFAKIVTTTSTAVPSAIAAVSYSSVNAAVKALFAAGKTLAIDAQLNTDGTIFAFKEYDTFATATASTTVVPSTLVSTVYASEAEAITGLENNFAANSDEYPADIDPDQFSVTGVTLTAGGLISEYSYDGVATATSNTASFSDNFIYIPFSGSFVVPVTAARIASAAYDFVNTNFRSFGNKSYAALSDSTALVSPYIGTTLDSVYDGVSSTVLTIVSNTVAGIEVDGVIRVEAYSSEAVWNWCYEPFFYGTATPATSSDLDGLSAMTEQEKTEWNILYPLKKVSLGNIPSTGSYNKVKLFYVTNASSGATIYSTSITKNGKEIFNSTKAASREEASLNGALADDGTKLSSQLTAFKALFKTTASFQQELLASTSGLRSFLVAANHLAPICSVVVGEEDASGNVSVTLTVKASSISSYAVSKINSDLASIIISSGSLISHLDTAQVAALQQQASTLIGTDALYSSIGDLSSTMPSIVLSLPKTAALAMVLTQSDGEGDVTLTNTAAGNYDIELLACSWAVAFTETANSKLLLKFAVSFLSTEDSNTLMGLNDSTNLMTFAKSAVGEYVEESLYAVQYEDSSYQPNASYIENVYRSIGLVTTPYTDRDSDNIVHSEVKTDYKSGYIVTETRDSISSMDKASMRLSNTRFVEFLRFLPKGSGPFYNNLAVAVSYESSYDDTYPDWSMLTVEVIELYNKSEIVRETFNVALDPDAISGSKTSLYIEDVINRYSSYVTVVSNYDNIVNFIETKLAITNETGESIVDEDGNTVVPSVDKVVKYIFNQITLAELNAAIFGDDYATSSIGAYAYTDVMSAIGYDASLCHLDTSLTDTTGEAIYQEPFVSKFYFSTLASGTSCYMNGGSRGNGWGYETLDDNDEVSATSTLEQALIAAYNGTTDPLIANVLFCEFDVILDANYPVLVKTAMSELASLTRNDCVTILDMNLDCANATQAIAKRKEQMQYNTYYTTIFSQSIKIDDEWTGKPVLVTPTWFLATKIPQNDAAYTEAQNFVGPRRGIISGYRELSWVPTEPEKTELYKNQLNYIEQDNISTQFATENTSQKVTSPLSMLRAVRSVLKLKRQMEKAARLYKMEWATTDTYSLLQTDLNNIAQNKVLAGGYEYISPVVSASTYDRQQKICRVKVDLAFVETIERFVFEFVVNRAS